MEKEPREKIIWLQNFPRVWTLANRIRVDLRQFRQSWWERRRSPSESFRTKVADLTTPAKRIDGLCPALRVYEIIDGRQE